MNVGNGIKVVLLDKKDHNSDDDLFQLVGTGKTSGEFDKWSSLENIRKKLQSVLPEAPLPMDTLFLAVGAVRAYRSNIWKMDRKVLIAYTMDTIVREYAGRDNYQVFVHVDNNGQQYDSFPGWDEDSYVDFWLNAKVYRFKNGEEETNIRKIYYNNDMLYVSPAKKENKVGTPKCTKLTLYDSNSSHCFTATRGKDTLGVVQWVRSFIPCLGCIEKFVQDLDGIDWK